MRTVLRSPGVRDEEGGAEGRKTHGGCKRAIGGILVNERFCTWTISMSIFWLCYYTVVLQDVKNKKIGGHWVNSIYSVFDDCSFLQLYGNL